MQTNSLHSTIRKTGALIFLALIFAGLGASTMVINSEDWVDVTAGMQLADANNQTPYFAQTSSGEAVMTETPQGADINLYESNSQAYLDMESRFANRGYSVNSTTTFEDQFDFIPDDQEDFVVISRSHSTSVVPATSLANHLDAWTVVIDGQNTDEVEELLSNAEGDVTQVGGLTSSEEAALEDHITDSVDGETRFELSINVLERIEEDEEITSLLLSDGTGLERDMFTSSRPVLLSGDNFLPEEAEEYVQGNEELSSVIVLGANLASVSEDITDLVDEDQDVRTLLKFGQSSPGGTQEEAVAISFYPLPLASVDLDISTAEYVPGSDELIVTFDNPSDVDVYKTSSITLVDEDGAVIETLDDDDPQVISSESSQVISYEVEELDEDLAENGEAEFVTSYGSNPSDLNSFVESEEEGVFEPPRILDISTLDVDDQSELEIEEVAYNTDREGFEVEASNIGSVETYTRLRADGIEVDGVTRSFSSDLVALEPDESERVFIPAELSEEDIEQNELVNIVSQFGERESFLINSVTVDADLETVRDGITSSRTVIILLAIVAVLLAYAVYRI